MQEFLLSSSYPHLLLKSPKDAEVSKNAMIDGKIPQLFPFKLPSTSEYFSSLPILQCPKKIREFQILTEFFEKEKVDGLEELLIELKIDTIKKGMTVGVDETLRVLSKLLNINFLDGAEKINNEESFDISDIIKIVKTVNDYTKEVIINTDKIKRICNELLKLKQDVQNSKSIKLLLKDYGRSSNKNVQRILDEEIITLLEVEISYFIELIDNVIIDGENVNNNLTKNQNFFHKYINKNLEILLKKIENEAKKILEVDNKIKRDGQGTFRIPKNIKLESLKFNKNDLFPILVGTTKTSTIFTFTEIKSLIDSSNCLSKLQLIMDSNNIYMLCLSLSKRYEELENLQLAFRKIDLFNGFGISGFKNVRVKYLRECNSETEDEFSIKCGESEISLNDFYHPFVDDCISNSLNWGNSYCDKHSQDSSNSFFITLSGPNTSGKSTILRSIALICYLTHIGAPSPVKSGHIPLFDCIRIRIGSDDSEGESTFMKEMREMREIVDVCNDKLTTSNKNVINPKSLILIDELGRGTSLIDGISISLAFKKFLKNTPNVFTIFVTHFDELKDSENIGEKNFNLFLDKFKLREGVAESMGIECARDSGITDDVIERMYEFMNATK